MKIAPALPKRINLAIALLLGSVLMLGACRAATRLDRPSDESVTTPTATKNSSLNPGGSPRIPKTTPLVSPTSLPVSNLEINPEALDGSVVDYWHVWQGEAQRLTDALVSEFNAANPWGIRVQASYIGDFDALSSQLLQAAQNGELPEIAVAYDHQALDWDAEENILVDLSNYINDPLWGLSPEEQADFYLVFWDHFATDDLRLGVPALRSGQMLYYNTSWARELGFTSPPNTIAEFKEQACAAGRANLDDDASENDKTGGWIISTHPSTILGWLYAFGAPVSRPDRRGYRFDTAEVRNTFGFLRQLYEEGCAWLPEGQSSEAEFAQRLGLFVAGSLSSIPYQEAALKSADNADDWTVIPFPRGDGSPAIDVYGPNLVILKSSPEKQLASWLFIKWLLKPENQSRWALTTSSFPLQKSLSESMSKGKTGTAQWRTALDLLRYAQPEPQYRSWNVVRWALGDATTQLFRWYFTLEQLPDTVSLLDRTAAELHSRAP